MKSELVFNFQCQKKSSFFPVANLRAERDLSLAKVLCIYGGED